jgi:hypothetical protein
MRVQPSAALDGLKASLDQRSIPYESLQDGLRVPAASDSGFDAWITIDGDGCNVALDGWHEEFDDYADGFNCFVWALSSLCRIAVTKRIFDHKWTLQSRQGDSWRDDSTTGLLFFPYFVRGKTRHLQNHWWNGESGEFG